MRAGSLCTGIGGLDLATEAHFGADLAWYAESDPAPCVVLEREWPGVPNLHDLTAVDWSGVEPVDVLTAGYPCQPFSHAGKRQGADDDRHLWPHVADAVRVLRPRFVVLENVAGHLSLGFDRVLGDLAEAGFDADWCLLRASDVGACHQRARLFIVARNMYDIDPISGSAWPVGSSFYRWWREHGAPADPGGERHGGGQDAGAVGRVDRGDAGAARQRQRARPVAGDRSGTTPADAMRRGRLGADDGYREHDEAWRPERPATEHQRVVAEGLGAVAWGQYAPAIHRWERVLGRPAPHPTDSAGRLNPSFVEWMMGYPAGWVDGLTRTQALKALGNAVVPQQASAALRELAPISEEKAA